MYQSMLCFITLLCISCSLCAEPETLSLISRNKPAILRSQLHAIMHRPTHPKQITVTYRANTPELERAYKHLAQTFPRVTFYNEDRTAQREAEQTRRTGMRRRMARAAANTMRSTATIVKRVTPIDRIQGEERDHPYSFWKKLGSAARRCWGTVQKQAQRVADRHG